MICTLPLQIGFAKIALFLNAPETNFIQSTKLTTELFSDVNVFR